MSPTLPRPVAQLSAGDARSLALGAQGLRGTRLVPATAGASRRRAAVVGVLDALGAVQLDTISVLARSHELVACARLGAVGRDAVEAAYWDGAAFEYWSHAACILPIESWPWFAFRRRWFAARGRRWHRVEPGVVEAVAARLAAEGPLTTTDLGGTRTAASWWGWSDVKVAMEWLVDTGRAVVTRRVGWRRVYDLPGRAIPAELLTLEPDDAACLRKLVTASVRTLGAGTITDVADVHRLTGAQVRAVLADPDGPVGSGEVVVVEVAGWPGPVLADRAALAALGTNRGRHRTTLLSPFDSLVWNRGRTERLFGLRHRLEAYTPAAKREHGYFAMPVLHRGALVGRVDPGREREVLVVKRIGLLDTVHEAALEGVAAAVVEAASWVGCTSVRVDDAGPTGRALAAALTG